MTDTPESPRVDASQDVKSTSPDTRDANRKLGLHPLVTTLVVIYFLILIGGTVGVAVWRDRMDMVDGLFGSVLFSAFIIGIPSWIAWRVTRSRLVGNITCTIIVGLILASFTSSMLTGIHTKAENDAALDKFDKTFDAQIDEQAELFDRAIAGEDVADEMIDRLDQNLDSLEQLGDESSGHQAMAFNAMAKVMRRLEGPMNTYNEASNRFLEAGGIDPATMLDHALIPERLRLIEEFATANEQFAATYASLEADLRKQLLAAGIGKDRAEFLVRNWRRGGRPDLIAKMRQADRDLVESFRGIVNTLNEAYGRWSVEDERVIFEDDEMLDQYSTHFNRMNESIALQEALQREIQQVVENPQASP